MAPRQQFLGGGLGTGCTLLSKPLLLARAAKCPNLAQGAQCRIEVGKVGGLDADAGVDFQPRLAVTPLFQSTFSKQPSWSLSLHRGIFNAILLGLPTVSWRKSGSQNRPRDSLFGTGGLLANTGCKLSHTYIYIHTDLYIYIYGIHIYTHTHIYIYILYAYVCILEHNLAGFLLLEVLMPTLGQVQKRLGKRTFLKNN